MSERMSDDRRKYMRDVAQRVVDAGGSQLLLDEALDEIEALKAEVREVQEQANRFANDRTAARRAMSHSSEEVRCPVCDKPGLWLRAFFRKDHVVVLECVFGCWRTFRIGVDPCVMTDEDLES